MRFLNGWYCQEGSGLFVIRQHFWIGRIQRNGHRRIRGQCCSHMFHEAGYRLLLQVEGPRQGYVQRRSAFAFLMYCRCDHCLCPLFTLANLTIRPSRSSPRATSIALFGILITATCAFVVILLITRRIVLLQWKLRQVTDHAQILKLVTAAVPYFAVLPTESFVPYSRKVLNQLPGSGVKPPRGGSIGGIVDTGAARGRRWRRRCQREVNMPGPVSRRVRHRSYKVVLLRLPLALPLRALPLRLFERGGRRERPLLPACLSIPTFDLTATRRTSTAYRRCCSPRYGPIFCSLLGSGAVLIIIVAAVVITVAAVVFPKQVHGYAAMARLQGGRMKNEAASAALRSTTGHLRTIPYVFQQQA